METFWGDYIGGVGKKVACWSTKTAISLKRVKIEEKLLWTAYKKSSALFWFFGSPPYFYFRFRFYGHRDGRFCLIFARTAQQSVLLVGIAVPGGLDRHGWWVGSRIRMAFGTYMGWQHWRGRMGSLWRRWWRLTRSYWKCQVLTVFSARVIRSFTFLKFNVFCSLGLGS